MDKVSWSPGIFVKVGLRQFLGDHDFFNIFLNMTDFKTNWRENSKIDSMIDSKTNSRIDKHHQVIMSNL